MCALLDSRIRAQFVLHFLHIAIFSTLLACTSEQIALTAHMYYMNMNVLYYIPSYIVLNIENS